ncbi:MAG: N-6 DNA methylase [Phycisphaerales bacterium]
MAAALGATQIPCVSHAEQKLLAMAERPTPHEVQRVKALIHQGEDVLGDTFCAIRSSETRRASGAVYTPDAIVRSMTSWAADNGNPESIVDPGTGSGRFLLACSQEFARAKLIGVETDPLAALIARANLAQNGLANRAIVLLSDYRSFDLQSAAGQGQTLFLGNPPYVRHHQIEAKWKQWLIRESDALGLNPSSLAGLHVHFFVATAQRMRKGDYGCFITSAEWLDVNYGRMVRQLFLDRLGGVRLAVIDPKAQPFPDAATTGAIACFKADSRPKSVFLQKIDSVSGLHRLDGKRRVRRERLESESRWSHLTRRSGQIPQGFVELGELCRVHRGQVTGANAVWIADVNRFELPDAVLYRTVTRAKELFSAGLELANPQKLRQVVDLPVELDELKTSLGSREWKSVNNFLEYAKSQGAHEGYVARARRAWWSVGLREPAPILATYMARRPPAFVENTGDARHLNIAHGLYPRERFSVTILRRLVKYLSSAVSLSSGRSYSGGLTKFEPREMERILVPTPCLLRTEAFA